MIYDAGHLRDIERHAIARLEERCGVVIPRHEYASLCADITAGDAARVATTGRGDPVYRLTLICGARAWAVWSRRLGLIVTFLGDLDEIELRGGRLSLPPAAPPRRAHFPRPGSERAPAAGGGFARSADGQQT